MIISIYTETDAASVVFTYVSGLTTSMRLSASKC